MHVVREEFGLGNKFCQKITYARAFDPVKAGLRKTLKEYEELALRYIWSMGDEGAGTRVV